MIKVVAKIPEPEGLKLILDKPCRLKNGGIVSTHFFLPWNKIANAMFEEPESPGEKDAV